MSSASTSLWVTQRMVPGPVWWIFTLRARQPVTSSAAPPSRSTRKMTMLVCTRGQVEPEPGQLGHALGEARGRSRGPRRAGPPWSRARRARPRRARPTWRMPPPSILRTRRAARDELARAAHQRADRGAEALGQAEGERVDRRARSRATGRPSATAALKSRAPSRWTGTPAAWAAAATASISSGVQQVPPWRLCVFSTADQAGRSGCGCCAGRIVLAHLLGREEAARGLDRQRLDAAEHRRAARPRS